MNPPRRVRNVRDLAKLQSWFCKLVCTPESRVGAKSAADARLQIYVRDYWARCIDSLREDFPGLERLLGEKKFRDWMEKYLTAHPSNSYTLRNLGARLLSFMEKKYREKNRGAALDMIRYHWAKIEAFDRPALKPFDPSKLTARQKTNLAEMGFKFQPHLTLLKLDYPVYHRVGRIRAEKCFTVVYRRDGIVYHREIEKEFYLLLKELERGLTLSKACAAVSRRLDRRGIGRLEKNARAWFENAVANGWLCAPKGDARDEQDSANLSERREYSVQNRLVAAAPR